MTTHHGFSSALRLLRRLPLSASYSRGFSASRRHLKKRDLEENYPSPKDTDYDYRKPCYAAQRNFSAHIRRLMRSTPNALTAIISCSSPQQYRDNLSAASKFEHTKPAPYVMEGDDLNQLPKIAGLLVSSFNTVTLTREPYVSFNIKLPSITYATIRASSGFTASGLKDARVADALVKRRHTPKDSYGDDFWHNLVENDGRLKKDKGGTWWMRCRLQSDKCVKVEDHMIVVAKVLECGGYEGGEGIGLIYAEGNYRRVGEVVDMNEEKDND